MDVYRGVVAQEDKDMGERRKFCIWFLQGLAMERPGPEHQAQSENQGCK